MEKSGRAKAVVYQPHDAAKEKEHAADVIVVAAGAIESVRLLLLSADSGHPAGLGNDGGQVGKYFTFHHLWSGAYHYPSPLYPERFGGATGQSHQFLNHSSRGKHGREGDKVGRCLRNHRTIETKTSLASHALS
jgi:choline dehydrogenase-like flavoprotein